VSSHLRAIPERLVQIHSQIRANEGDIHIVGENGDASSSEHERGRKGALITYPNEILPYRPYEVY
jgi:hypothetical protein